MFKNTLSAAKRVCGVTKTKNTNKQAVYRKEFKEVKELVKTEKEKPW